MKKEFSILKIDLNEYTQNIHHWVGIKQENRLLL